MYPPGPLIFSLSPVPLRRVSAFFLLQSSSQSLLLFYHNETLRPNVYHRCLDEFHKLRFYQQVFAWTSLFLTVLLPWPTFFFSPPEDRLPPSVVVNKGLVLDENSVKKLTTLQLSASDQDSEPGELIYRITKQTSLGHLEHAASPGSKTLTAGSVIPVMENAVITPCWFAQTNMLKVPHSKLTSKKRKKINIPLLKVLLS